MAEPTLLPVRPGTLSEKDKAALRKAGVIVVEHDQPETLRLLRPSSELDSSDMLLCAMKALVGGEYASTQRELFTKLVAKALESKAQTKGATNG